MSEVIFYDEGHKYESVGENKIDWVSVSTLTKQFEEPFIAKLKAATSSTNKKSKWYGIPPDEILGIWEAESLRSTTLGTWYHAGEEKKLLDAGRVFRYGKELPVFAPIWEGNKKIAPNQRLEEGIYPEIIVYLKSEGVCGQSDETTIANGGIYIDDHKGLCLTTEIPTKTGFVLMGDIRVGQEIFDGEGNLTQVECVSEVHYNPCYKILFDTNDVLNCDHEHKWVISKRRGKGDYFDEEQTTEQMFEAFNRGEHIRIQCAGSLSLPDAELPIDPYVLGAWLGDGSKSTGHITSMDDQLWEEIQRRGYILGEDTSQGCSGKAQGRTIFNLRAALKSLNLLGNKHIPDIYLRASHRQRLDLLRGFMDTDGYYHKKRKRCVMNTTQEWQANAILELVSSLGNKATKIKTLTSGFGKKNIPAFMVTFKMTLENPFLIRNKEYLEVATGNDLISTFRYIKSIEKIDIIPTKCIAVKSPLHTYLAGRSYIKTHNTNKEVTTEAYRTWEGVTKKLNRPLQHLDAHHVTKFALQLSTYAYIIKKHNPLLEVRDLTINHILFEEAGRDKYDNPITLLDSNGDPIVKDKVKIPVPYLGKEVELMLKWLKINRNNLRKN